MSTGLSTQSGGSLIAGLPTRQQNDKLDALIKKSASGVTFLPRINLFGYTSREVQDGKIQAGHFGLTRTKEQMDDLGDSFLAIPLADRAKAVRTDPLLVDYDIESETFQQIMEVANQGGLTGNMWGFEYLLWLPDQNCFATFYLSSATHRAEADSFRAMIGNAVKIGQRKAENKKKNKWFIPTVTATSQALSALPDNSEAIQQATKFMNPPKSAAELTTAAEQAATESQDR